MDKDNEIFLPVNGYDGLYEISNHGRIKSVVKNKILFGSSGNGYKKIILYNGSLLSAKYIHRLVAIHFIQNGNRYKCVNHKDGNKHNNNVENLEWCTHSENNKHAFKIGLKKPTRSMVGKFGNNHHSSKPIEQLDEHGKVIAEYSGASEAFRSTGIRHISDVCYNKPKYKTAGGFKWRFKTTEI